MNHLLEVVYARANGTYLSKILKRILSICVMQSEDLRGKNASVRVPPSGEMQSCPTLTDIRQPFVVRGHHIAIPQIDVREIVREDLLRLHIIGVTLLLVASYDNR